MSHGLPEIVVANRGDRATQYFCLNQGKGRFSATCEAFADYSATTITPADVNRDGRIDLVVPHRDGGQSYVYLNGGNGTKSGGFAPASPVDSGQAPYALTVADLNRDGHPDIIVGYVESPSAVFFGARNRGSSHE